ncbi:DegT/DnrJ/EryC1/StrS family aminotransferase [Alloacidobacterium dinghuense]|uniref:DegT/DnrJ/EryC1/StrS family aminotransferase n=1 Tax=Alloacidobacterium dinghuense TaxID=2763107 RepID=A0A7G8BE12_9BACT|nr:DegT/DnrJ/EryC1/StrS family aminotransferase [Alloacidobacterium dinghuense]QNI30782.1 DegT/DnrJ/EryC1/StrS family aminotransferase [Alloacidobacterium dinghuense]
MTEVQEQVIPFHSADVGEQEAQAAADVVRSGWLTMGAKTIEFEQKFASYVGAKHAVGVNSCTAGLHLALDAIGLREGDEVLVPTTTFTASAEVVVYFKAKPVLVDIDPETLCIDPIDAERRITSKTRAIIPVHFSGQPCDMDAIRDLATRYNLRVIEDAAHSLPASYRGVPVGAISELTAFSFYATKTLTTGEGGMVTTDNEDLANRMRIMRLHGIGRDAWKRYSAEGSWYYEVLDSGFKYNLTDIQSAIGLVQLDKCDEMRIARERIARLYSKEFATEPSLQVPTVRSECDSSWHLYVLRLNLEQLSITRSEMIEKLRGRGIGCSVHFIPLHMHPFYKQTYGYSADNFPVATQEYARYFSLPIFPTMSSTQIDYVIENVVDILKSSAR